MTNPAAAERAWDVCRTTLGWKGERAVQRNTFLAGWHARDPEFERLRQALRDVVFDLHNCQYGGDQPRCEHIADGLKIARAALAQTDGDQHDQTKGLNS